MDESGNLSDDDELDEFEYSQGEEKYGGKNPKNVSTFANKPYDEAYEVSQDLSVAESFDARDKNIGRERQIRNDRFDEAIDVSQSVEQSAAAANFAARGKAAAGASNNNSKQSDDRGGGPKPNNSVNMSKSQTVQNQTFDEAYEVSQSGSEDSVGSNSPDIRKRPNDNKFMNDSKATTNVPAANANINKPAAAAANAGNAASANALTAMSQQPIPSLQNKQPASSSAAAAQQQKSAAPKKDESSDEEGDNEESYENLEGAYNPRDFHHLNVTVDVKDLFSYIERFKPQEVELETTLKCFIPEYIPAIGDMDSFIKIPRPDAKEDELGLKVLDEPAASQSDPTVLELQLRAMSKKLQYGDVVVRSIENASKNPHLVEKWMLNISELHRTKPPPQVHYKRNMPDMDLLMEAWPDDFEAALATFPLPSPDLDLSLLEYSKLLCSILDVPVYDNPIESLHVMFTLFTDFRNNPHFQPKSSPSDQAQEKNSYGDADDLKMPSYK